MPGDFPRADSFSPEYLNRMLEQAAEKAAAAVRHDMQAEMDRRIFEAHGERCITSQNRGLRQANLPELDDPLAPADSSQQKDCRSSQWKGRRSRRSREPPSSPSDSDSSSDESDRAVDRHQQGDARHPKDDAQSRSYTREHFKPEEIGVFNPHLNTKDFPLDGIVEKGNRLSYRSVHMFLEAAQDYAAMVNDPKVVRLGLSCCLQETAAQWWTHQLTHEVRVYVHGSFGISRWRKKLYEKFNMSTSRAFKRLDEERYNQYLVHNSRSVAEFVTTVCHLAKDAGLGATDSQIVAAINRMAPRFREVLARPGPTRRTTLDEFIKNCEDAAESWENMFLGKSSYQSNANKGQ